jgi:alpha-tubulin suppressor-like RCC1 family protein
VEIGASVTRSGGFTGAVNLSVTGAPAGVTATVGAATTSGNTITATITLQVGPAVPTGSHSLTVHANGTGVSEATSTFQLTVNPAPSYQLQLAPAVIAIVQGEGIQVAVTINRTNFTGAVTLSFEGPDPSPPAGPSMGPLPAGVSGAFTSNPTSGNSSTLAVTVGAAVVPGDYSLRIRASATGLTDRVATLALTVQAGGGQGPNIRFEPTEIAVGASHACRLKTDGAAYCWGADFAGQIGDGGANATQVSPTAVAGGLQFGWIVAGDAHTCGLVNTGQAYCWGRDDHGQLGNDAAAVNQSTPVAVSGGHDFVGISASGNNTCGLTAAGAAYCWGDDFYSQIGDGAPNLDRPQPVAVLGGHVFRAISVGGFATCALDAAGKAWCWGNDGSGELGDGSPPQSRNVPVAVSGNLTFASISSGYRHSCALNAQGQAYCWGSDLAGQVGDGAGAVAQCGANGCSPTPAAVVGGLVFSEIDAGGDHGCAWTAAGTAHCWGADDQGQIGDNAALVNQPAPTAVSGGHLFRELDTGGASNTCGVDTAGDAWCWGDDSAEQLGQGGGIMDRAVPAKVLDLP